MPLRRTVAVVKEDATAETLPQGHGPVCGRAVSGMIRD